jgi:hypothetical protein
MDWSLRTDTAATLSADQKDAIKQSLFEVLSESIDETLLRMGLTRSAVSYRPGIVAEGCWPRPNDDAVKAATMGAMYGAMGALMAAATSGGTRAVGNMPILFDEKGLAC